MPAAKSALTESKRALQLKGTQWFPRVGHQSRVLYMSFDKFLLAVESRDLSQANKSIIRVSSFSKMSDGYHNFFFCLSTTEALTFFKINALNPLKACSEIKETTFWVGHFTTISGHFIANYINTFHKTEVLIVILRCLMSLDLNWIKSYNINHKKFDNCVLQFWKKTPENLSPKNGHFSTICGHFLSTT